MEDETTRFERLVKDESDYFANTLKDLLRKEFPRPAFSEPVTPEAQATEWQVTRTDPSLVAQFYADQGASIKTAIADARKREGLD